MLEPTTVFQEHSMLLYSIENILIDCRSLLFIILLLIVVIAYKVSRLKKD